MTLSTVSLILAFVMGGILSPFRCSNVPHAMCRKEKSCAGLRPVANISFEGLTRPSPNTFRRKFLLSSCFPRITSWSACNALSVNFEFATLNWDLLTA
jgi:hypothetical protein